MAILFDGSRCVLCREVFVEGDFAFTTSGLWLAEDDPLEQYCDAGMHWRCYAAWPFRARFAWEHFKSLGGYTTPSGFPGDAFNDARVMVTVVAKFGPPAALVLFAETGSTIEVALTDWEAWIASGGFTFHPWEEEVAARARQHLVACGLGTVEALKQHAQLDALLVALEAEAREAREAIERYDAMVRLTEEAIARVAVEGYTCAQCKTFAHALRRRPGPLLRCKRCGTQVDLTGFGAPAALPPPPIRFY